MPAAQQPESCPPRPAWRSVSAIALFAIVVGLGVASDLLSKQAVFDWLRDDPGLEPLAARLRRYHGPDMSSEQMLARLRQRDKLTEPIFPGLRFTLHLNPGVAFSMPMPRWAVAGATVVTMIVVAILFATSPARLWGLHLALAMILSGALGNLYDRLLSCVPVPHSDPICYHVRDFIDFSQLRIGSVRIYPWVFNLADVYLVVGVGILVIHWLRHARGPEPDDPNAR